jgi:ABC-type bacteriocin/lantibiotic exporter with double-glycine peptidase domain
VIACFHGLTAEADQLRHAAGGKPTHLDDRDLVLTARSLGLKTRKVRVAAERFAKTPLPALALDKDGQHFILAGCDGEKALIVEAGAGAPTISLPIQGKRRLVVYGESAHRRQQPERDSTRCRSRSVMKRSHQGFSAKPC